MTSNDGATSNWFRVKTGVKQDCIMSGLLLLITMDRIRTEKTELTGGIEIN